MEAGTERQNTARQNTQGDRHRKAGYSQAKRKGRQAQAGRKQPGRTYKEVGTGRQETERQHTQGGRQDTCRQDKQILKTHTTVKQAHKR
jgi:hypothetical protein